MEDIYGVLYTNYRTNYTILYLVYYNYITPYNSEAGCNAGRHQESRLAGDFLAMTGMDRILYVNKEAPISFTDMD